jgi:hypothetical protein
MFSQRKTGVVPIFDVFFVVLEETSELYDFLKYIGPLKICIGPFILKCRYLVLHGTREPLKT